MSYPNVRCHLCLQVIPIDERGQLHEAFNIRVEELTVVDLQFLQGCARPTVAVLYQDTKSARHIKTYEVVLKDKVGRVLHAHCVISAVVLLFMDAEQPASYA